MWDQGTKKLLVLTAVVIMGATSFAGCFGSPPPPPPPPANIPPFANAAASTSLASAHDAVSFTATGSDLDGTISSWRWNFGDGMNATVQNASHAFDHQGTYYVTLNITDNSGGTYDTVTTGAPIRVDVLPNFPASTAEDVPLASLTLWSASSVIKPTNALTWSAAGSAGSWNADATSPGTITEYKMDYGDGSAADTHDNVSLETHAWDGNFTHTYATAGVFAANLKVTTSSGKSDFAYWTVVVVSTATTPGGVKNPRTLIIETFGQPQFLDPAVAYDDASGQVIQAVYETLITYDGAAVDRFIPLLAETMPTIANGGITNSNMTYTFNLRHGVKFHTGAEMKAADVVYSFKRVIDIDDPGGPAWILTQVLNNTSVVAVDDYTVQFNLMQPYGAFVSTLAYTVAAVVNKATVEANGGLVYHTQNTWMNSHTDGTGPWILKSWVNGQQIVLDKNPNYHNTTTAAKLDHVIIRFVTEFSTRLLELRSGDADIITVPGANRPEIQAVAANPAEKVKIESGASTWVVFTGAFNFNINVSQRGDIGTVPSPDNVPSDFFQDVQMRKAFSLAFNYDDYITNVAKGLAFRLSGIIPKGMYGYESTLPMPQYDLDAARTAYNASAYVAANGYSTGFNLTIGYNAGNTNRQKASENLKAGVEALGPNIHLNVVGFEWSVYLGLTLHTPSGEPGALGVFFIGWGPDYADPDDYVVPFCKTGGTYPAFTGYSNATVDAWIAEAGAIPNGPDRLALYHNIQESIVNDYVYLYVTEGKNFHVAKTWVTGWYFNPMMSGGDLGGNMASINKA